MSPQSGAPQEQPLDPALIRVQKRLRRLMIIGLSTLGIGVAAVLVAIIYRFYIADTSDPAALLERTTITGEVTAEALGLAPDAELVEQTLDGDRMAYTFRDGAGLVTVIVDITTMTVVSRFRFGAE
jgi:hypothetical protein